jgi:3-phenylpropionate/trans-cinnamate dioxygenase ferredoxin subunit
VSFVRACALADVPLGTAFPVALGDAGVAVVHTEDGLFAIRDECSHASVPLSDGDVEGTTLECYMHGSRFDLRTGRPLELPATTPVPVYPVRTAAGDIEIDLDNPIQTQES